MSNRFGKSMVFACVLSLLTIVCCVTANAQQETPPAAKETAQPEVRIYRIKYQTASALMGSIATITQTGRTFGGVDTTRIAVDQRTNSLIVSADAQSQKLISSLIQSLDVETPPEKNREPAARDVMIRVVWLVDERLIEGDSNGTTIPPDLLPTVEKLRKKFGLEPLVTAGQIFINQQVVQQSRFSGSGTASIQGNSQFFADGMARFGDDEVVALQMSVVTESLSDGPRMGKAGPSSNATCELSSTISAPIGQPVIFGMTPIESKTSLFVVQVLDAQEVTKE